MIAFTQTGMTRSSVNPGIAGLPAAGGFLLG
jgi:hypothetical protein